MRLIVQQLNLAVHHLVYLYQLVYYQAETAWSPKPKANDTAFEHCLGIFVKKIIKEVINTCWWNRNSFCIFTSPCHYNSTATCPSKDTWPNNQFSDPGPVPIYKPDFSLGFDPGSDPDHDFVLESSSDNVLPISTWEREETLTVTARTPALMWPAAAPLWCPSVTCRSVALKVGYF